MRSSKAAVLLGPRKVEVQEFPRPASGDMDGWLRVDACGVCASDLPLYRGEVTGELPVVLGHEIAGTVELGEGAKARWGVTEGDRVILERWIPCGHCELCYTGRYRLCKPVVDGHRRFYGGAPTALAPALWGGFAEHVYLSPDTVLHQVSPDVPTHYLPLFTPLANSISWLQQAGVRPGSTVLIQGPGQEGLCAVLAATQLGADHITVIGLARDGVRLDIARRLGAHATLTVGEDDVVEGVRELTGGRMADCVLDVTSSADASPVATAVRVAAISGTLILAAEHSAPQIDVSADEIIRKALTIKGVFGRDRPSIRAALRLIERDPERFAPLATHVMSLAETGQALELLGGETVGDAIHISVMPGG